MADSFAASRIKTPTGGGTITFGPFQLDPGARSLTRHGSRVAIGARALDLLIALAAHPGEVVSKADLFAAAWPDTFIEESNLRRNIAALRKALGDDRDDNRIIASVAGRGYSLVLPTRTVFARHAPHAIGSAVHGALPAALVDIVGRDSVVEELSGRIERDRLVTITGPGGIGKTAVALAVAHRVADRFIDGAHLIDLGSLNRGALVAATLASLLRIPTTDTQRLDHVVAHLRGRHMLLVFDNCEHVIDAVSPIAEAILQGVPELHILATSREPLRSAGEWVHRLQPLPLPSHTQGLTAKEALTFPAVQLFAQRAGACDGSFVLTDAEAPLIAEIVTKLDGLPLAIELAATRVPLFGVRGLLARLDDRFAILTKGRRTAVVRHQALGALVDWSFETLSDAERTVWRRLAVFRGALTIEAADAIGNDRPTDPFNIVDILDSLVEKSLVCVLPSSSEVRYRLLETLRLYASNKLIESGEAECVRRRHAEFWLRHCRDVDDNWVELPTPEWLARHGGDMADIRAALDWAFSTSEDTVLGIRLTAASAPLWFKTLLLPELRSYVERAIACAAGHSDVDDAIVMRLQIALAHSIFHTVGATPEVATALKSALTLAENRHDVATQLQTLWALWGQFATHGDYASMFPWLERVKCLSDAHPEIPIGPLYDRMAALTYHLQGEQERALRHAEAALTQSATVARSKHDGLFVYDHKTAGNAHYCRILWIMGYPDRAAKLVREVVDEARVDGNSFAFGFFLIFAACPVAIWSGDLESAHRYLERLLRADSGIAFNVWQTAGHVYNRALSVISAASKSATGLWSELGELPMTPFLRHSLCTFDWRLLPESQCAELNTPSWCLAELLRAKGEMMREAGTPGAEEMFLRAVDNSRRQKARSWELRAATSLANLWRNNGRAGAAKQILGEVYDSFTEGFATPDLRAAEDLLSQLR